MRRFVLAGIAVGLLTALVCSWLQTSWFAGAESNLADPDLIIVDDHFTTLEYTDVGATSAAVDLAEPGTVRLPGSTASVALRPNAREVVAWGGGKAQWYSFDGRAMTRQPSRDVESGGGGAAAFSGDGEILAVAAGTEVRLYSFDAGGKPKMLGSIDMGERIVALAGGLKREFWVATQSQAVCLGWNGSTYMRLTARVLNGLSGVNDAGVSEDGGVLAVVQNGTVGVYRWNGSAYRKNAEIGSSVRSVDIKGSMLLVLSEDGVSFYDLAGDGLRKVGVLEAQAAGSEVVGSPWSRFACGLTGVAGMEYRGASEGGMRKIGELSISGVPGDGYAREAVFESRTFTAVKPCTKIRLEVYPLEVPDGTSFECWVSTDGGNSWQHVEPGVNEDVPEGIAPRYRLILRTVDEFKTPVLDRVVFLQVAQKVLPLEELEPGAESKVRLVE
ncbi:MAG: hypothetical protein ACPLRM_08115 [Anaerolineae bacterium]